MLCQTAWGRTLKCIEAITWPFHILSFFKACEKGQIEKRMEDTGEIKKRDEKKIQKGIIKSLQFICILHLFILILSLSLLNINTIGPFIPQLQFMFICSYLCVFAQLFPPSKHKCTSKCVPLQSAAKRFSDFRKTYVT